MKKSIVSILFLTLCLTQPLFGQGAKREASLRDGSQINASMELDISSFINISTNYLQLYDCANYELVGICWSPGLIPIPTPMHRYYVPFQLTEGNVRPDATTFVQRAKMKAITQRAFSTIESQKARYIKEDAQNIKLQKGKTFKFQGKSSNKLSKGIKKFHNQDKSFIGVGPEDGQTSGYSVGTNHNWHNTWREFPLFKNPWSPYRWCHDYSHNAYKGPKDKHPEIKPFTALGILNPKTQKEKMIPLIAYFMSLSQNKKQFKDLADRTPKKGDPVLTACYRKKHQKGIGHPEFFGSDGGTFLVPKAQQGREQSKKVCPGFGFLGPAGPFWIFAKSYFPAGNALMGSLRGLVVAFNTTVKGAEGKHTVDHETGRHRLHSYEKEFGHKSDHLQRLWPKPPLKGWKKGCGDTKDKGYYLPPQIRPEDSGEANLAKDENYGQHYRFAHYTSVVCCPAGWIPQILKPGVRLKEG